ncbi:hypothetical protein BJV78DRAFT_1248028 [Lactifluus subvellereus]|nr:hypothetical protein BJV78DRAFT_1248028 [Lactifluus subvellereus]
MQVTSELRKRLPFTLTGDDDHPDSAILDDQEQEEVIQTLKAENDASDRRIWFCLRLVMGCFAFLHAVYVFRRVNPLNPFLPHAQPPRILFDIPFALLHTVILLGIAILARLDVPPQSTDALVPHRARVYAIVAIAPMYCMLTGQGLTNTAWWSFAFVAAALHHFFHSLILQGRTSISQLEVMKYDARGA